MEQAIMKRIFLLSILFYPGLLLADPSLIDNQVPRPVFYWYADRREEATVLDITTQGIICIPVAINSSYGSLGRTASFDGVAAAGGSRFYCGLSTSLNVPTGETGLTLAVYGRLTGTVGQNGNGCLMVLGQGDGSKRAAIIWRYDSSKAVLSVNTFNAACSGEESRNGITEFYSTNPSTGIGVGQNFFYIVSLTNSETLADINGRSDNSATVQASIGLDCNDPVGVIIGHLGRTYSGQPSPPMDLRAAIIWDVALSSAQKQSVYQSIITDGGLE